MSVQRRYLINLDLNSILIDFSWLIFPVVLSAKTLFFSFLLFLIVGMPIAYFLAFYKNRFKYILEIIVMFPLIFPPIATGFLLLYIFGKNGIIGKALNLDIIFSFQAIVLASFLSGLPLFVKPVCAAFKGFNKNTIEASYSLGKGKFKTTLFVILPNTIKIILSSLILALARGLGEVGITLMLGGNIIGKTDTISLAIFNAVYDGQNQRALILSTVLVVLSSFMFICISLLDHHKK